MPYIDPAAIDPVLRALTGGIGALIVAGIIARIIYGSLTQMVVATLDEMMPDTERRRWRTRRLVNAGLDTMRREEQRRIRGEESEGL